MLILRCLLIFSLLPIIVKGDMIKNDKQNGEAKKSNSESTTEFRRKCDQHLQPYQTAYNTDISYGYLSSKPNQILSVTPVLIQSNNNGESVQNSLQYDNFNNYVQSVFNVNNPSSSLQQEYAENSNQPHIIQAYHNSEEALPHPQRYQNQLGRQPLERYPNDIQSPHHHLIIQFTYPNQQQEQPHSEPIQQNHIPANYYNKKYVEDYEKHHSRLYNQIIPRQPLPERFRTNHIKQFQNDITDENNNGLYSNYPMYPYPEEFKMENQDDIEPISLKYNRDLRARRLKRYRALKNGTPDYGNVAEKPIRSNRATPNSPEEGYFESVDHEQLPIGFLNSIRALIRHNALKQNVDQIPEDSRLQRGKTHQVQSSDQSDGEQASSVFLPTYSYVGDPSSSGIGLTYAPSYDISPLPTIPLQDFHHFSEIGSPFSPTFGYGLPVYPSNLGYTQLPVYGINPSIIRAPETSYPHPPKKESYHESGQETFQHLSEYLTSPHFKHAAISLAKTFGISAHQLSKLGLLNSPKEKILYKLGLYPSRFF